MHYALWFAWFNIGFNHVNGDIQRSFNEIISELVEWIHFIKPELNIPINVTKHYLVGHMTFT